MSSRCLKNVFALEAQMKFEDASGLDQCWSCSHTLTFDRRATPGCIGRLGDQFLPISNHCIIAAGLRLRQKSNHNNYFGRYQKFSNVVSIKFLADDNTARMIEMKPLQYHRQAAETSPMHDHFRAALSTMRPASLKCIYATRERVSAFPDDKSTSLFSLAQVLRHLSSSLLAEYQGV